MLYLTNDGLTGFLRVGGPQGETLVPDLATATPPPSNDGLTYTFEVRPGIRYSNGQPVRPGDFRRAIERVFDAHAGGDALYTDIVGAAACEHRSPPVRCDLQQGIEANEAARTVTFHLTRPDPDFPSKLALPFADAVPQSVSAPPYCRTVTCGYADQPQPVPATGPYMIIPPERLGFDTPNGELVLARNPRFHEWSADAQPSGYPNRIVLHFGLTPGKEASQVEQGRADWSFDPPPSNLVERLLATAPDQVHRNTTLAIYALTLNPRVPPFTYRGARQAVNYAINRSALSRLSAGSNAQLTCQILPPGMLGYRPYCPYTFPVAGARQGSWLTPDIARARHLVNASGTRGTHVTVWLNPGSIYAPAPTRSGVIKFGQTIVAALRSIGYPADYQLVANQPSTAQIATGYWADDYPNPGNFLQLLFSCATSGQSPSRPGNRFCDHSLDRRMSKALQAQAVDPTRAAAQWAHVDRDVTDAAPWAPLFTRTVTDTLSKRVGNYEFNPQLWILLDQLWVK